MMWESSALLAKGTLYIERAFETESRESELLPFWATIGLEFVGRAVLASVHPSLLADPQTPESVLFACGIGDASKAKSVHAKTVFARCKLVVSGFTDSDFVFCMSLMDRRNEELHTAAAAFESLHTNAWLADYYRVLEKLLKHLKRELSDVLSEEDEKAASQMITAAAKALLGDVKKLVAAHKKSYEELKPDVLAERRTRTKFLKFTSRVPTKIAKCPSCGEDCLVTGETIRSTSPKLVKDQLYWESIILPTGLRCEVCGLELTGHEAVHIVELGGQFSMLRCQNAAEHYLEGVDPSTFFEEEYQNS